MGTENLSFRYSSPLRRAFISLVDKKGEEEQEIGESFSIGRGSQNRLVLKDPYVSSQHGRILRQSRGFVLKDLNSLNGCLVNGSRVKEVWLKDQDRIQVGQSELIFSKERFQRDHLLLTSSQNKAWNAQLQHLSEMARSEFPILILGPSGVGKEVLAQLIHKKSRRSQGPFFALNCGAFQEDLVGSELFGHKRGSFTGASFDRQGAFGAAKGGTVFLDEIGDLPLSLQPNLLRVLENQEFRMIGSDHNTKADVRVLAATHQDLKKKILQGEFREDLFYRLNILQLNPPSLKERMEDFESFLYFFARNLRVKFSFSAIEELKKYHWPGNIRELKNFVLKTSVYFSSSEVKAQDVHRFLGPIPFTCSKTKFSNEDSLPLMKRMEKELMKKTLLENGGNQAKAAQALRMPKSTFHDKVKTYNIFVKKK